jgi:DNA-directed RNA polymerase specialized sigma24 family protein
VFLVLANRARVVRRKESGGSWLFGVAHRVAARARNRAARRRALDRLTTERTTESYVMAEHEIGCEILHEEVNRLPERLRAPVVLCYLEGLTYAMAAQRLALSDGTLGEEAPEVTIAVRPTATATGRPLDENGQPAM